MKIKNVTPTSFSGKLLFLNKKMKLNKANCAIGIYRGFGHKEIDEFNHEFNDIKKIMNVPYDDSEFAYLELDANAIKDIEPNGISYAIPTTDYVAYFNFAKKLSTKSYTQILSAYTAAKVSDDDVTIFV